MIFTENNKSILEVDFIFIFVIVVFILIILLNFHVFIKCK